MQLRTLLVLASATAGLAFRVPEGTSDGLYVARMDVDGREVHEPLDDALLRRATPGERATVVVPGEERLRMERRQTYWETYCGCGITVNSANCDAAVADLKAEAGDGVFIPAGQSVYSIRGDVVAFGCNLAGSGDMYISASTITTVAERLTSDCGLYIAGTGAWTRSGTAADIAYTGYMQYSSGLDFCANAVTAPVASC